MVAVQAQQDEAAIRVGLVGWANVEKARAVGQFYYIVDMGSDADIFIGGQIRWQRRIRRWRANLGRCICN